MTNRLRISVIRLLTVSALFFPVATWAQQRPAAVEKLAKTYGLDSFGQLDAVRYTFNLELPALKLKLSRSWEWHPKSNEVSYEGMDKDGKPVKATYVRYQPNLAANVKDQIDPAFTNDNYWFIFPFHAYWDTSAIVTVKEKQKLPLGKGLATLVSVKYPPEVGGDTPGDTWDLFLGPDGRIKEFTYHRGGPKKPSLLSATWADYKKAGPLLVSDDHRGSADGSPCRIYFTNVAYKLAGSDAWVDAK